MKMKKTKILGLVLALIMFFTNLPFGSGIVHAETGDIEIEISFPDTDFKNYVSDNFDEDDDGYLNQEEIREATSIDLSFVSGEFIKDLKGIEFLTSLEYLTCSEKGLTELDLSKNKKLKKIYCYQNKLTKIILGEKPYLTNFYCHDNNITDIDLSKCPALTELMCYGNDFTALDLIHNKNLAELTVGNEDLKSLDLSNNTLLTKLECRNSNLENLNLSNNKNLEETDCSSSNINILTLGSKPKLKKLNCMTNKINTLDLSACTELEELECSSNELTSLDLTNSPNLKNLSCQFNQLQTLTLGNKPVLDTLNCNQNQLTSLDLSSSPKLTSVVCSYNNLDTLTLGNKDELTSLECKKNKLTDLNLSNCQKLTSLECNLNNITKLDLSKCKKIETIDCSENQITNIDLANDNMITSLNCSKNQITSIDLSKCSKLNHLNCNSNQIKALEINNCPELINLHCENNKIASLDTSNCPNLYSLYLKKNEITNLNLTKNDKLNNLGCALNKLTSLDLLKDVRLEFQTDQDYYITVDKASREYKYSDFPGSFKKERVINANGAKFGDTSLVVNMNTNLVTYYYKANENNNETIKVNLHVNYSDADVIVPDPGNPGSVPNGYVRITFDAGFRNTIDGEEYENKYGNQLKYIDVREGLTWGNEALKNALPKKVINNDGAKEFTKWDQKKPTDSTEVKAQTFTAMYKQKDFNYQEPDKVTFRVKKQPKKLEYKEGENLDLTGLIVTLIDAKGNTNDITIDEFETYGITTDPKNETTLSNKYNGRSIQVKRGKETVEINPIKVIAKEFDAAKLDKIEIKTPANKMVYTDGESLDLTGLVVTLTDTEGETKDVELKDFEENKITTNPQNGTSLTEDNNGTKVTIAMGDKSVETEALKVNPKVNPPTPQDPDQEARDYWIIRFLSDNPYRGYIGFGDTVRIEKNRGYRIEDLARFAPEAIPYSGYEFAGWSPYLYGNQAFINDDMDIYARFEEIYVPRYSYERRRPRRIDDDRDDRDDRDDSKEEKPVETNQYDKLEAILFINDTMMQKSVNGVVSQVRMDIAPFIYQARTMLPIRYVAESLGFMVTWDANTRTVYLVDKENIVQIPVDTNNIIVNGKAFVSDVKPMIKNNRTMLPVANVARALGLQDGKDILWDAAMKFVALRRNVLK